MTVAAPRRLPAAALAGAVALALLAAPPAFAPAHAAESYDNCSGTIASIPTVITTQGVWCMKKDLATASTSGYAIAVTAPNVTIDCNGFKLGGLAGGVDTNARGIGGLGTTNLTVRGCNIRGFYLGIHTDEASGGGHVIEDNRFDGNTLYAIRLWGADGSVVRRNLVIDTAGALVGGNVNAGIGVTGEVDILDNTVRGVSSGPNRFSVGIFQEGGATGVIAGNRISNLAASPASWEYGIYVGGAQHMVRGNSVTTATAAGFGLVCGGGASTSIYQNMVTGPGTLQSGCYDAGGNSRP